MGAISTTISLNDGLTSVIRNMYSSINMLVSSLSDVDIISQNCSETIIQGMSRAVAELGVLESRLTGTSQTAENVRQAFNWQDISTPQVFMGNGLERAEQELTALQFSVSRVIQEQERLTQTARGMTILPKNAKFEVENINTRIGNIANTISRLEEEKKGLSKFDTSGISRYNSQIENLRSQMYQAETAQNALNTAMRSGDLSQINSAYSRLNGIINNTEKNIRDNNNAQDKFNESINQGNKNAKGLLNTYAAVELAQKGLNVAKSFVKNTFGEGFELNKIQSQFQARLGSEEGGTALFNKVQEQAKKSAFGVSELAKNTSSFLSVVNKESQLDGLNSIAEKLALFDTTGQGLEGAGFSVKEALSGDIQSLAERFNISKSLIRGMKIDELGKTGDIDGFISQFEKLLEVQKMGDSAYEQMLKDPKVQLDMFISNMKTGFATASQSALKSLTPLITRFNEWFSSESATQFFQRVSNGFQEIVNAGLAVWDVLSSVGSSVAENWESIVPILTGIASGFVAISVAINAIKLQSFITSVFTVNNLLKALNPTNIMLGGIGIAAVAAGIGFGWLATKVGGTKNAMLVLKTSSATVFSGIKLGLSDLTGHVFNLIYQMKIGFQEIPQAIKLAFFTGCKLALQAIENMINGAIGLLNNFNSIINSTFGTSLNTNIKGVDFSKTINSFDEKAKSATSAINALNRELEAVKAGTKEFFNEQLLIEGNKIAERTAETNKAIEDAFNGNSEAKNIEKSINDLLNSYNFKGNNTGDIGNIGNVGNVDKVGGTVDVASEDLKYLRDIAEQENINQFTTKMVVPDVKITFTGDIRETADVNVLSEAVKENIISELNSGAEFAHV